MSKEIIINKETFTCTKKKMKSALKNKGIELSLSEVANLFAQSFGYKNEFDMQNTYFKEISKKTEIYDFYQDHASILKSIYEEKTPAGYIRNKSSEEIKNALRNNNVYTIESYQENNILCLNLNIKKLYVSEKNSKLLNTLFYNLVKDISDNYLSSKIDGNILISGLSNTVKTTLANKLISFRKNLVLLKEVKENCSSEEEIRVPKDVDAFINNKNVIASIHSNSCLGAISSLSYIYIRNQLVAYNNVVNADEVKNKISCVINLEMIDPC